MFHYRFANATQNWRREYNSRIYGTRKTKQTTPYVIPGSEWQVFHKNLIYHVYCPILSTLDSTTTKRRLNGELQWHQDIYLLQQGIKYNQFYAHGQKPKLVYSTLYAHIEKQKKKQGKSLTSSQATIEQQGDINLPGFVHSTTNVSSCAKLLSNLMCAS